MRVAKLHSGLTSVGTMWLSEGLSQATYPRDDRGQARGHRYDTIDRRCLSSLKAVLFYYNATSNVRKFTCFDSNCVQSRFEIIFLLAFY